MNSLNLYLSGNGIGEKGAALFESALSQLKNLRHKEVFINWFKIEFKSR